MRAFIVVLSAAAGIVLAAGQASAQELVPAPAVMESGSPTGGRVFHYGVVHPGFVTDHGSPCGCGGNGCCACQGSYKYPVMPQYTYFWPGIYSQQRMTQYVSPLRYPDLNPIPDSWKADLTPEDKSPYSGYRY